MSYIYPNLKYINKILINVKSMGLILSFNAKNKKRRKTSLPSQIYFNNLRHLHGHDDHHDRLVEYSLPNQQYELQTFENSHIEPL